MPSRRACGEGADSFGRHLIEKPTERSAGPVRFATFNFENLFARPKVFDLATWSAAPILEATGPIGPPRHVVPS